MNSLEAQAAAPPRWKEVVLHSCSPHCPTLFFPRRGRAVSSHLLSALTFSPLSVLVI